MLNIINIPVILAIVFQLKLLRNYSKYNPYLSPELHTLTDLRGGGDQRGDFMKILPDFRRGGVGVGID